MKTVAIVDYGMGNLDSVARAVERCRATPLVSGDPVDLGRASSIILPGVGAFADGMTELQARSLDSALRWEVLENRVPLLGICLGMQLLASKGFEGGETDGLGLIAGEVRRLEPDGPATRIPHVGWNEVEILRNCPIFEAVPSGKDFYFVHSFHFVCEQSETAVARTRYCGGFVSGIRQDSVFGVQFHPEKSQKPGLAVLGNFLAM